MAGVEGGLLEPLAGADGLHGDQLHERHGNLPHGAQLDAVHVRLLKCEPRENLHAVLLRQLRTVPQSRRSDGRQSARRACRAETTEPTRAVRTKDDRIRTRFFFLSFNQSFSPCTPCKSTGNLFKSIEILFHTPDPRIEPGSLLRFTLYNLRKSTGKRGNNNPHPHEDR
eukprot:11895-Prorocentrum_minimum.AAC.1